jgi:hypothetical protein
MGSYVFEGGHEPVRARQNRSQVAIARGADGQTVLPRPAVADLGRDISRNAPK